MNNEKTAKELFQDLAHMGGYSSALSKAALLCARKSIDYQGKSSSNELEFFDASHYFPFGPMSYVQMIHVKSERMVSLVKSGKEPHFEALLDSAVDIINYAAFLVDYLSKNEKPEL